MSSKAEKGQRDRGALLKGISHEIRIDVLRIFDEREASSTEIADELGLELKTVSYHVRRLRREGAIELTREEPRRGAVERFYRAVTAAEFDDEGWAKLPEDTRRLISRTVLQVLFSEAAAAEHAGTLDARVDRHLSWMPFPVDEQGWCELADLLAEVFGRFKEIKEGSAARLADAGESGEMVIAALMSFMRAPRSVAT